MRTGPSPVTVGTVETRREPGEGGVNVITVTRMVTSRGAPSLRRLTLLNHTGRVG